MVVIRRSGGLQWQSGISVCTAHFFKPDGRGPRKEKLTESAALALARAREDGAAAACPASAETTKTKVNKVLRAGMSISFELGDSSHGRPCFYTFSTALFDTGAWHWTVASSPVLRGPQLTLAW
ncbi:hypothetical protein PtB15_15B170 [Puccinia triticina]|nr:hypothetical protein PtB15_15B170 [Puccinia triticina]